MLNTNMKYKLLATDLDGTLLNQDSNLTEYAVSVLRAVEETGVKVTVCTGRTHSGALFYLKQLGLRNPGVFCNGAQICVCLDGKVLDETPLPNEEAKLVIRLGEELGAHPRIYMDEQVYVSRLIEEDKVYSERTYTAVKAVGDLCGFLADRSPMKIINYVPDQKLVPVVLENNRRVFQDRLYITESLSINNMIFVEYMNAAATKGRGVKKLADMFGLSRDEVVVAGDHLNDLTMFQWAGFSIAPRSAHPDILAAASAVCLSNAEDGVPKKIAEMFL